MMVPHAASPDKHTDVGNILSCCVHFPAGIALRHLMFRPGMMKLKIIPSHILKSVILIVHSDVQGRCVLTTHRYVQILIIQEST